MLKKMEGFSFLVEAYHISQRVVRFVLKFHYFSFYVITCFNMFQPVLILSSKTDSRDGGSGELWHHGLLHILLWIPKVCKRLRNYKVINHTKVCKSLGNYKMINHTKLQINEKITWLIIMWIPEVCYRLIKRLHDK